jgi:hypothetical protein
MLSSSLVIGTTTVDEHSKTPALVEILSKCIKIIFQVIKIG